MYKMLTVDILAVNLRGQRTAAGKRHQARIARNRIKSKVQGMNSIGRVEKGSVQIAGLGMVALRAMALHADCGR